MSTAESLSIDTAACHVLPLPGRSPARPGPLRGIVVRTCDRPGQLEALLRTLVEYERLYGARRSYVVLDDSRRPENVRRNADLITAFAAEAGTEATHVDDARWTAIVERLISAVPESARAATFAVARRDGDGASRFGGGRAFNLAALLAAGGRYVLLDDDNLLPLKRPPDAAPGLRKAWSAESGTRFFDSADIALEAGVELDEDPIEHALALCGHSLADAVGTQPEERRDEWDRTRIVTVTHGHRGASCSDSSLWMYLLRGDARESFWRDAASYRRNRRGESLWYGTTRAFLQPSANFTPFAVDATRLLPPTMPDGRAEDSLFGVLIARMDPAALAFHSNLTIGHRQEGQRRRTEGLYQPVMPSLNMYLVHLVADARDQRVETDPGRRLEILAARVRAAGRELVESLMSRAEGLRGELVRRLEAAVAEAPGAPDYWRADVERMIEANRRALAVPPPLRLQDWPQTLDIDTGVKRSRERLDAFAATLESWPRLWEYAKSDDLGVVAAETAAHGRAAGRGLGQPQPDRRNDECDQRAGAAA